MGACVSRQFSYLGVEVAAVAAAKVRDPDHDIPKATRLGTLATAVVYNPATSPPCGNSSWTGSTPPSSTPSPRPPRTS